MQTVRRPVRGHSITSTRSGCVVAAARVPSWRVVHCKRTVGLHEQQSGAFCLHVTAVVPVATSQCKTLAGSGVFRRHSLCTGPASGRSGRNKSVRAGGYDKLWQPRKKMPHVYWSAGTSFAALRSKNTSWCMGVKWMGATPGEAIGKSFVVFGRF